jgi:electron transfer flavoprotein beta subunit
VETCVIALDWRPDSRTAQVRRELEGGSLEVREVQTPAVLAIQSGINEPRYATFRAIKQAEQREIALVTAGPARPGATVLGLGLPGATGHAEMLTGRPAEIAARIAAIVRERAAR